MRSFLPGKSLPEGVVQQIEKRQEVLGLTGDRFSQTGPSSYAYYNQKTPWIRVISSVNIENNDTLARINILSNGVLENHNSNTPAGYEISPTLGPRPKPGITSMDLKTHNRFGSLRTATVNFTVFSIEDLNIYERLYMSPGYTALLEWGHSKALTLDGEVEDVQPLDLDEVFQEGLTMSKVFAKIQEQRRKYNYNYDASFGLVKNFSWSLSSDGSYECSMDIVSIGTAFESMNISAGILPRDYSEFLINRTVTEAQEEFTTTQEEQRDVLFFFTATDQRLAQVSQEQLQDIERFAEAVSAATTGGSIDVSIKNSIQEARLIKQGGTLLLLREGDLRPEVTEVVKDTIISADPANLKILVTRVKDVTDNVEEFNRIRDLGQGTVTPEDGFYKPNIFFESDGETPKEFQITAGTVSGTITFTEGESALYTYTTTTSSGTVNIRTSISGRFIVTITEYTLDSLETEEVPAITSQNDSQVNISDFLEVIRKYQPELRSRIHFLIDQLLKEARDNAAEFTEGSANPDNFYKEFTSSYLLEKLRNYIYPESPEGRARLTLYSTTAAKYITIDQTGTSEAEEGGKENRPDLNYNYIQFGAFLEILNYFIPRDQNKVPLFSFDTSVQQVEGEVVRDFRTLDNYHCSVDVSKCLLPRTETPDPFIGPTLQGVSNNQKRPVDSIYGILLEKQYLYGVLNDNMVKGELKFYDVLQTILEDIVRVTGRVNDLQLQYYENFRTFRIVDRNFTDVEEEYPSISIFGKNSFTKQANLASRLTPEISTMLAIAAQNEPTSNGIQGNAFKEFNKNQTDRIIEIRQDPDTPDRDLSELQQQFASVFQYLFIVYGKDQNRSDIGDFSESVQKLGLLPPNVISDYVDFCNYQIYRESSGSLGEEPKANNFIIPYELNLTVDGISGLEVMSAFVTDDTLIPDRYGSNGDIGFLITGLQHKVSPQGWDTTINSQIFNLDKGKRKSNEGKFQLEENPVERAVSPSPIFTGPVPNADKLRSILSTLNYTEKAIPNYKYGEISSGGDLEGNFTASLIKFFTELKSQFGESLSIRVTGGNDVYHQNKKTGDHPVGKGLDFTIQPYTTGNSEKIRNIARNNNLNFLDEYQKRTANQTGAHIHIYG